jgi:hypothetical protein
MSTSIFKKCVLFTEEHPLGEMSIALDAPASMERVPEGYIDLENEFIVSPRRFKKKGTIKTCILLRSVRKSSREIIN